jgi:predicted fused transcriptional regulator/phosphomethylpyrimidine kinase
MENYLVTSLDGREVLVDVSKCTSEMRCDRKIEYSKKLIREIIDKHGLDVVAASPEGNHITLKNKTTNKKIDNAYLTISTKGELYYHYIDKGFKEKKLLHMIS